MVKKQNMASGDHTIPGNPAEYYEMTTGGGDIQYPASDNSGRGTGGRVIKDTLPYGGTPAMYGVQLDYANSNVDGIRNSINDGMPRNPQGASAVKIGTNAPMRNPVGGINPMKQIQRK
jgi:hypothetical protein